MEARTSAPPERMMVVSLDGCDARHCEPVAAALEQFTPVAEALRPGLHAFGTRGPSRYFGGEQALSELVAQAVADAVPSEPKISVGAADGLFAAYLAARMALPMSGAPSDLLTAVKGRGTEPHRAGQHDTGRHSAGLQDAGLSASTAVLVVPPQQSRQFLAGLPLTSLADPVSPLHSDGDGPEALLDILWRLGMRTLGDVAELSEADMVGRFGWTGLLAHRLARGIDDRPTQARPAGEDACVEAEVDPPAERIETVAFMARALADAMVDRLARDGLDCVSVCIEAESDSGHASRRRWRHELRFTAADVVDRVRWQLEGWYRSPERPTGPVTLIRITPLVAVPADGRQLGMWGARSQADERAARALARVQGLLGPEAVTVPRLSDGRRPADIGRRIPLHEAAASRPSPTQDPQVPATSSKSRKSKKAKTAESSKAADPPWPGRLPPPLPAVVLAHPEPVTVTDQAGTPVTVSGRGEPSAAPCQVTTQDGNTQRVTAWAGPWPLDERWWRPATRRRQARFQLVLEYGSAHLCVLESTHWHHEATYD